MPKITKNLVERASSPPRGQGFIRDDGIEGFALRLTAGGAKSFVWEGRIKGRTRRVTIGQFPDLSVAIARIRAQKIRSAVAEGYDPSEEGRAERAQPTFADLVEAYFERHANKHKRESSVRADEWYLAKYVPSSWRSRRLSDIGRNDVEKLHAAIGEAHGPYGANHTVRLLRCMLNLARDWKLLKGDNPAARIKLFKEERRERYLSPDELERVNEALAQEPDWRWRAYFPLALMLGARRSELLSLRWADIDLNQRTLRLRETKAGRPHFLPLPGLAITLLEKLPSHLKSDWVFPSDRSGGHIVEPAKAWQRIRNRAAVQDVRIHDLRHTLASWLVAEGFSLPLIGRALNHRHNSTTERYAHLALDPIREALEQNAVRMFGGRSTK
ncbi:MAG: tyrosine-type recombinase/integrase [Candidatus Binataceae bacterium]